MLTVRTALVTGANRGLGLAVAVQLYKAGHQVVVTARDGDAAAEAAAEIGAGVRAVQLDVTDQRSVDDAAAAVGDTVGDIDILVNNAGVFLDWQTDPCTVPLDVVRTELDVNALGAWRVSQAFAPGMVARGWGRIAMVSSGTGSFGNGLFTGAPGYSISKLALNGITVLLAKQLDGTGVLVNAVNPGLVRTRMRPDAAVLPEDAAVDIVHAATLPDGGPTGAFLRHGEHAGW